MPAPKWRKNGSDTAVSVPGWYEDLKPAADAASRPLLLKLSRMLLPFVRELFADVETLPAFTRVASHLREGTGRIRVSGLSPTAKALLLVLLRRMTDRP